VVYRKFPKGMGLVLATFEGKLESGGPYGDGGYRLKFTVDKIEKLEDKAKASGRSEPAWVPQNCATSEAKNQKMKNFRESPAAAMGCFSRDPYPLIAGARAPGRRSEPSVECCVSICWP
jgi:hypothetical protein